MPGPFDFANTLLNNVGNLIADIANAGEDLAEDSSALAVSLGTGFSQFVESSVAEWEAFLDGLSVFQAEVMAELAVFMEQGVVLLERLFTVRISIVTGDFSTLTSQELGELVQEGWIFVLAGADLLAKLIQAFPDDEAITDAIATASPLLARKLGLDAA